MVLADSHGISRVPRYSGTCPASQQAFAYGAVTLYGRPFQTVRLACWLVTRRPYGQTGPTTPPCKHDGLGYVRVRSPLLAESLLFSLPVGTEMVHFPTLPSTAYVFSQGYPGISQGGFPHSEIAGSKPVCGSPTLIAAYHVLHRLLAPRHSPYALSSLTITSDFIRYETGHYTLRLRVVVRNYPLAGYSVVKDPPSPFRLRRRRLRCAASLLPRVASRGRSRRTCETWWRIPGSNR